MKEKRGRAVSVRFPVSLDARLRADGKGSHGRMSQIVCLAVKEMYEGMDGVGGVRRGRGRSRGKESIGEKTGKEGEG